MNVPVINFLTKIEFIELTNFIEFTLQKSEMVKNIFQKNYFESLHLLLPIFNFKFLKALKCPI